MYCKRFDCDQRSFCLDARYFVQYQNLFIPKPAARTAQHGKSLPKPLADCCIEPSLWGSLDYAKSQIAERDWIERPRFVAGHHRVRFGTRLDCAGDWPDRVKGVR